jgi:hypothetical protein
MQKMGDSVACRNSIVIFFYEKKMKISLSLSSLETDLHMALGSV